MSSKVLIGFLVAVMSLGMLFGCAAPEEEAVADLEDGVFTGYSQADENGFAEVSLTLEGGEIVEVDITEYDGIGREKIYEAYGHEELEDAHQYLAEEIAAENTYEVDAFTGATSTSEKVSEAASFALEKAGDPEEEYLDGTFMGMSSETEQGWAVAWVTLENGEMVDLQLEETTPQEDEDGEPVYDAVDRQEFELKDEDYGLEEWHEAQEEMAARMLEAQDTEVDAYSGATGSSERWMEAVDDAMDRARLN